MPEQKTNHVFVRNESGTICVSFCTHCGTEEKLVGKIPVKDFMKRLKTFIGQHKFCPKPEKKNNETE